MSLALVNPETRLFPTPNARHAANNVEWMKAVVSLAQCGEWLTLQGYRLVAARISTFYVPVIEIAPTPKAQHQLKGLVRTRQRMNSPHVDIYRADEMRFGCWVEWTEPA